jgi:hypothetical protein
MKERVVDRCSADGDDVLRKQREKKKTKVSPKCFDV